MQTLVSKFPLISCDFYDVNNISGDFRKIYNPISVCLYPLGPQAPRNWKRGRQLGVGAFGQVFLCCDMDTVSVGPQYVGVYPQVLSMTCVCVRRSSVCRCVSSGPQYDVFVSVLRSPGST